MNTRITKSLMISCGNYPRAELKLAKGLLCAPCGEKIIREW